MANTSGRGQGGSSTTIIWAVAAIVLMGAFVVWISRNAEPSVPPSMMEEDTAAMAGPGDAAAVTAEAFEANMQGYHGQQIELQNVAVVQHMGSSIVWVELPSGSPFLVKVSDQVAANGLPAPQSRVNVIGRVVEKTDSVLAQWEEAGVLASAGQRTQAEFGSSYIEATAIRPAS